MKKIIFSPSFLGYYHFKSFLLLFLFSLEIFSLTLSSVEISPQVSSPSFSHEFTHSFQHLSILSTSSRSSSNLNLVSSTIFGDSSAGSAIAVDSSGNIYITGSTHSSNFPTKNAFQPDYGGGSSDAFVLKLSSSGRIIFSSYFGGSNNDIASSIAVDQAGNCYIIGSTSSSDFPTLNAYNSTYGNKGSSETFFAKFNSSGSLLFSSYFGADSQGDGIAVDQAGNFYITGSTSSSNFPTKNAFNSTFAGNGISEIYFAKFDSSSNLLFSSYFGGNSEGTGFTIDSSGNFYLCGTTYSANFPTKNAYNSTYSGFSEAFIAKFDSSGNLVFSTFFGGSYDDFGSDIAVDNLGNVYLIGSTNFFNFPILNPSNLSFMESSIFYYGHYASFLAEFNSLGNLVLSTTFVGNSSSSIAVDNLDNVYLIGQGISNVTTGIQSDFLAKINTTIGLLFFSYFGGSNDFGNGIVIDHNGNVYITGLSNDLKFPVKNPLNDIYSNGSTAFLVKFSLYSSSTNLQLPLISPLINLIFSSYLLYFAILTGILIIFIVTLVEFRKYSNNKRILSTKAYPSFYKFLLRKLSIHRHKPSSSNYLSDKTLSILDEIEKENTPKD